MKRDTNIQLVSSFSVVTRKVCMKYPAFSSAIYPIICIHIYIYAADSLRPPPSCMFTATFLPSMASFSTSPPNPNPISCASQLQRLHHFLMLEDGAFPQDSWSQTMAAAAPPVTVSDTGDYTYGWSRSNESDDLEAKVIAFRTKSEVDVMDDGFKWRKYGKKMVKSSPNPRNYYRCSSRGCFVKKRIERDMEDASYVITTYKGIHNHPIPDQQVSHEYIIHSHPLILPPHSHHHEFNTASHPPFLS